jgi:hypothetical protein
LYRALPSPGSTTRPAEIDFGLILETRENRGFPDKIAGFTVKIAGFLWWKLQQPHKWRAFDRSPVVDSQLLHLVQVPNLPR